MHQRPGDHQTTLHPAGEHTRTFVTFFPQIELFQILFAARNGFFTLNAVVPRLIDDDLLDGFKRVEVKFLRHQAKLAFGVDHIFFKVVTKDADAPGGFVNQRADNANGG